MFVGFNVRLTITTDALDVVCEDGDRPGETICHHPMQGVSFASGNVTLDPNCCFRLDL